MDLTADSIEMDQQKNEIIATYRRDSAGNIIGRPKMIQADTKMDADFMRFNTKTQKGITQSTITAQGKCLCRVARSRRYHPRNILLRRVLLRRVILTRPTLLSVRHV